MEMTITRLVLALLPLLVPICIIQAYGLRLLGRTVGAFVLMLVKYAVVALVLYVLAQAGNVWINALVSLAFVLFAAVVVTRRARLPIGVYMGPVLTGTLVAVLPLALYMAFLVLGSSLAEVGVRLLPLVAVLCGGVLEANAHALGCYYMGLRNHGQLYRYLVGNGATPLQALFYFRKRAIECTLLHYVRRMSLAVVASTPLVVWALLLCGQPLLTAVALQVAFLVSAFAAAMLAMTATLYVAGRYVPDGYALLAASMAPPVADNEADETDKVEDNGAQVEEKEVD